uniref:Uncharacterized protein n=1 Tax=Physcomitrium patens TaxID=3218 RepID=A0A2K1IZJ8_PHYPA|nr:hypothetical protein PHYPA_022589 [Physcomitrium patens]
MVLLGKYASYKGNQHKTLRHNVYDMDHTNMIPLESTTHQEIIAIFHDNVV